MKFSNKNRRGKIIDDTEKVVYDFKLRAPFAGYRPIDYHDYEPFINYKTEIDLFLEKLFEGEYDAGNKAVLDPLIFDMAVQAEEHLNKQETEHIDKINAFYHRRCADRKSFEKQLENLQIALERNNEEKKDIEARLKSNKFRNGGSKNGQKQA